MNITKKIDNNSSNPVRILDYWQNLGKIEYNQKTLEDILTYLLMDLKFENSHLIDFSKFTIINPENFSPFYPNFIFRFISFGVLEVSSEEQAISKPNERFEIASTAAHLPLSSIKLTQYSRILTAITSS